MDPISLCWRKSDDGKVTIVDAADVFNAEGYMLFYRKKLALSKAETKVIASDLVEKERILRLRLDSERKDKMDAAAAASAKEEADKIAAAAQLKKAKLDADRKIALQRQKRIDERAVAAAQIEQLKNEKIAAANQRKAAAAANLEAEKNNARKREAEEQRAAVAQRELEENMAAAAAAAQRTAAAEREAAEIIAHERNLISGIYIIPITPHFLNTITGYFLTYHSAGRSRAGRCCCCATRTRARKNDGCCCSTRVREHFYYHSAGRRS